MFGRMWGCVGVCGLGGGERTGLVRLAGTAGSAGCSPQQMDRDDSIICQFADATGASESRWLPSRKTDGSSHFGQIEHPHQATSDQVPAEGPRHFPMQQHVSPDGCWITGRHQQQMQSITHSENRKQKPIQFNDCDDNIGDRKGEKKTNK